MTFPATDTDQYEPTCELRRFGVGDVLEQRWRKMKIGKFGHVVGYDYEWRAVPHVYGEAKPCAENWPNSVRKQ